MKMFDGQLISLSATGILVPTAAGISLMLARVRRAGPRTPGLGLNAHVALDVRAPSRETTSLLAAATSPRHPPGCRRRAGCAVRPSSASNLAGRASRLPPSALRQEGERSQPHVHESAWSRLVCPSAVPMLTTVSTWKASSKILHRADHSVRNLEGYCNVTRR